MGSFVIGKQNKGNHKLNIEIDLGSTYLVYTQTLYVINIEIKHFQVYVNITIKNKTQFDFQSFLKKLLPSGVANYENIQVCHGDFVNKN